MCKKGSIWIAKLDRVDGSVQKGERPVLIVSNNNCNYTSPVVNVIPLTKKNKKKIPVHYYIEKNNNNGLSVNSTALVENIQSIDKRSLLKCIGEICEKDIININEKLKIQLNIG